MLDKLFGPTVPALQDGLGFEAARQRVIAHNIANLNTPGFQAKDLFHSLLSEKQDEYSAKIDAAFKDKDPNRSDYEVETLDDPPLRPDGNDVNPETQMANLAEVELRYRSLTLLTSRFFKGLKSVISGDGK
jgi:flagellar basal-body rod protein FlgB